MKFLKIIILATVVLTHCTFGYDKKIKEIEIVYPPMPIRSKILLDGVVKDYNKKNSDVRVSIRIENHNLLKIVGDEIENGEGPDGFLMSYVFLKNAISNGWVVPINNFINHEENQNKKIYIPKNFIVGKNIYGYHIGTKGNVLFYNKNLLKEYNILKPKDSYEIQKALKNAREKGIIPMVNDTLYGELKHSVVDELLKYHLYMEKQKLFVYSKDIGYKNRYDAFFSGKVAFIIGFVEDIDKDDFYRRMYGLIPWVGKAFVLGNELTVGYVMGKNSKYPKETMDFFRHMNRLTRAHTESLYILM